MFHRISLIFEVFGVDLDGLNDDDFSCHFVSFDSAKHEFLKLRFSIYTLASNACNEK